jgi:hypothetical protein
VSRSGSLSGQPWPCCGVPSSVMQVNLVSLATGVVLAVAGALLLVASRRRRLTRIAHEEDPGRGIAMGVSASLLGVGLLAIARSF